MKQAPPFSIFCNLEELWGGGEVPKLLFINHFRSVASNTSHQASEGNFVCCCNFQSSSVMTLLPVDWCVCRGITVEVILCKYSRRGTWIRPRPH